jgi:hypothetical protein
MTSNNLVLGGPYSPRDTPNWLVRCMRTIERWASRVALRDQTVSKLTENLTLYVRSDGKDSNSGRQDSSTGAFLTHQAAINATRNIDRNGFDIVVQSRLSSSTEHLELPQQIGDGHSYFRGNTTTPTNHLIHVTGDDCIFLDGGAEWQVEGFELRTTTSGHCFSVWPFAILALNAINFGTCARCHIFNLGGTVYLPDSGYTISGGARWHKFVEHSGIIIGPFAGTITLTGTPAFTGGTGSAFAGAWGEGHIEESGVTYSGAATGRRFWSTLGGQIVNWSSSNLTYYPGDSAGVAERGGNYEGITGAEAILFNGDTATANRLDDYEEGTFVPVLTTDNVDFTSVTYDASTAGSYTKIGDTVFFQIGMTTDAVTVGSASGTIVVDGLPFVMGAFSEPSITIGYVAAWTSAPYSALGVVGFNQMNLYERAAIGGSVDTLDVADVATGANSNTIYLSGHFKV